MHRKCGTVDDGTWDQHSENRLQSKKGVKIARAPFFILTWNYSK